MEILLGSAEGLKSRVEYEEKIGDEIKELDNIPLVTFLDRNLTKSQTSLQSLQESEITLHRLFSLIVENMNKFCVALSCFLQITCQHQDLMDPNLIELTKDLFARLLKFKKKGITQQELRQYQGALEDGFKLASPYNFSKYAGRMNKLFTVLLSRKNDPTDDDWTLHNLQTIHNKYYPSGHVPSTEAEVKQWAQALHQVS